MAQIRLIPSTYAVSSTRYLSVTNPSNAYANIDSTNYATITNNRTSTTLYYYYLRGFNFSDIPSNATINSFTVKIKGYESGLATGTSYAPRLANGTSALSNTTASSNFGTSTTTITIPTGALTWQQIINYGSSFTIMVYVRRNNRNTTGYFYCYGAEILVDYTVSVYHNVSVTNNSEVATVSPLGQQSILEGEDQVITISGVEDSSELIVTDNNVDVTSQLVIGPSQGSDIFNPATFVSSTTTVTDQNNALTGTDSTTYASMPIGQRTQNHMIYAFDVSSIPSNATINSVSCVVKASTSTSTNITTKTVQLYSGSTAKGSISTIPTTTGGTVTLSPGTWTRQELENIQIRFDGYYNGTSSNYSISFYGANLTINYTIAGSIYTYTISNISSDHAIVVEDANITKYTVSASSSYSGATITPTSKQVIEGRDVTFTITTQNLAAVKLVDNNVDVTSSIVGSSGSYTYTIQNISGDHTLVLSEKPQYTIAVSSDYSIASLQTSAGTVYEGQSATITLTTSDLSTTDVFDNNVSIISSFTGSGTTYTYTLSNISESHILVATEKATVKLFIKTNGTYLRAKKIFKNINGVWTEINLESLTDHNVYIYGGVITTDHDEIGTVSHTGDDIIIEINDNALSSGTYTLRYDDATRTPIENIDEITTFTIS